MLSGRALGITLLCVWASATPASAQGGADDPIVDSNGPAGREYELPLNTAREDAAGGQADAGGDAGNTGSAPLFGTGIESPSDSGGSTSDGSTGAGGSSDAAQDESGSASGSGQSGFDVVRRGDVDGASHSGLTIALGAILVLAIGALVGVVIRRPRAGSDQDASAA